MAWLLPETGPALIMAPHSRHREATAQHLGWLDLTLLRDPHHQAHHCSTVVLREAHRRASQAIKQAGVL